MSLNNNKEEVVWSVKDKDNQEWSEESDDGRDFALQAEIDEMIEEEMKKIYSDDDVHFDLSVIPNVKEKINAVIEAYNKKREIRKAKQETRNAKK